MPYTLIIILCEIIQAISYAADDDVDGYMRPKSGRKVRIIKLLVAAGVFVEGFGRRLVVETSCRRKIFKWP